MSFMITSGDKKTEFLQNHEFGLSNTVRGKTTQGYDKQIETSNKRPIYSSYVAKLKDFAKIIKVSSKAWKL